VNRDQAFLLPPDMREWLPPGHPVWLVIRAVEVMDTGAFHALRRRGGAGAAGYDPDMLVALLVWAYANGVTSSRRIEQLCRTDVAFRVICGGSVPDHATVARFRAGSAAAVAGFFAEVLALCARLGMGRLGVVALDSTKIAASASRSANRAGEHLRELAAEAVAAHARADAEEDEMFGPGRVGDEVPEDAWSPRSRDDRIAAAVRSLREEREAAEARRGQQAAEYLDAVAAGRRPRGVPRPAPRSSWPGGSWRRNGRPGLPGWPNWSSGTPPASRAGAGLPGWTTTAGSWRPPRRWRGPSPARQPRLPARTPAAAAAAGRWPGT
jgi:transposase